jgi:hypothetical protein
MRLLAFLLLAGCTVDTSLGRAAIRCGQGNACPAGYTCGADGYCRMGGGPQDGGPSQDGGVPDGGGPPVVEIAAGLRHTCDIVGGAVRCWGANDQRQLGDGTDTFRGVPVAAIEPGLSDAVAVSAGDYHTCALGQSGAVRCWGLGPAGRVQQPAASALHIASGYDHACAVLRTGRVACWGINDDGQLAYDTDGGASLAAQEVPGITAAVAVTANQFHTCALLSDGGAVRCWGQNAQGQLGNGRIESPRRRSRRAASHRRRRSPPATSTPAPSPRTAATSGAGATTTTASSGSARTAAREGRRPRPSRSPVPRASPAGRHTPARSCAAASTAGGAASGASSGTVSLG